MRKLLKERLRKAFELVLDRLIDDVLGQCLNCGAKTDHYHHAVPRIRGGLTTIPVCHSCHGLIHDLDYQNHSELTKEGMRKAAETNPNIILHDEKMFKRIIGMLSRGIPVTQIRHMLDVGGSTVAKAKQMMKESTDVPSSQEISETDAGEWEHVGDPVHEKTS